MHGLRRGSAAPGCGRSGPRAPWWRAAAASIALLAWLGVGHVLPALHFALVAHRICAAHGELVHEAGPLAKPAARADAPGARAEALEARAEAPASSGPERLASRTSAAPPAAIAGQHADHEHDHCGVLALPSSSGVAPPPSDQPALQVEPVACAAAGERPAHVGIALLLHAPKLAPPVASPLSA